MAVEDFQGQQDMTKSLKTQTGKLRTEVKNLRKLLDELQKKLKSAKDDAQLSTIDLDKWATNQRKAMEGVIKNTENLHDEVISTTRKLND